MKSNFKMKGKKAGFIVTANWIVLTFIILFLLIIFLALVGALAMGRFGFQADIEKKGGELETVHMMHSFLNLNLNNERIKELIKQNKDIPEIKEKLKKEIEGLKPKCYIFDINGEKAYSGFAGRINSRTLQETILEKAMIFVLTEDKDKKVLVFIGYDEGECL